MTLRPAFDVHAPPNSQIFGLAQAWNSQLNRSSMIQQDFTKLSRSRLWGNCINGLTFVGGGIYGLVTAGQDIANGQYLGSILPVIISSGMIYFGRHAVRILQADYLLNRINSKHGYQVAQRLIERTYRYHQQAVTPHWK